jgi:hypothetical protein
MLPQAARWVRFSLLACVASCSLLLLAAVGIARADEPVPYLAPADRALEPELSEQAACPDAEVPLIAEEEVEGEEVEPVSPELRELGHMRLEQQQACLATTDRLDEVTSRLWWVTAQVLALDHPEPALAEVNEWLQLLSERDEPVAADLHHLRGLFEDAFTDTGSHTLRHVLLGGEEDQPLPVLGEFETATMGADPELVSSIDASGEAVQSGLYIIAGLLVGLFIGGVLWRLVDRGT